MGNETSGQRNCEIIIVGASVINLIERKVRWGLIQSKILKIFEHSKEHIAEIKYALFIPQYFPEDKRNWLKSITVEMAIHFETCNEYLKVYKNQSCRIYGDRIDHIITTIPLPSEETFQQWMEWNKI